jgi:hypothetical protein
MQEFRITTGNRAHYQIALVTALDADRAIDLALTESNTETALVFERAHAVRLALPDPGPYSLVRCTGLGDAESDAESVDLLESGGTG